MLRSVLLCFAMTLAFGNSTCVSAAEPAFCGQANAHPIDQHLAAAIEQSGGVTVAIRDAQTVAFQAWDEELSRLQQDLLGRLPASLQTHALASQAAWQRFDRAQVNWEAALLADQGSSTAINLTAAAIQRRRERACSLWSDLQFIRDNQP